MMSDVVADDFADPFTFSLFTAAAVIPFATESDTDFGC